MLKSLYTFFFFSSIFVYPKIMEWMGSTSYGVFSCDRIANQPLAIKAVYLYCLLVYLFLITINFWDFSKIPIWILYLPLLFTVILGWFICLIFGYAKCKDLMLTRNDRSVLNKAERFSIFQFSLLGRQEDRKIYAGKSSLYDKFCTYFITFQISLMILPIQYAPIVFLLMCNLPNPTHSLKLIAALAPLAWLLVLVYLLSTSSKWTDEFEGRTVDKLLDYSGLYNISNLISLPLVIFLCGAYTDFAGDTYKSFTQALALVGLQ